MLLIHVRTVAFLSSLFTTVQCVFWIVGYILYVLAYSCGYNTQYFNSGPGAFDLPSNFGDYYIWYLQGFNCTTSPDWINSVRHQSPDLLVILLSIGLCWNTILLTTSIYMIAGFYSDIGRLGLRLKLFSSSVLLVSAWDLILVIVVTMDFYPLLVKDRYVKGMFYPNSTKPNITALAYFTEVFTVLIILLSRLLLFWILNVFFATYLLAKNANEVIHNSTSHGPKTDSIKNNVTNVLWDTKLEPPKEPVANPEKDYFGSRFKRQIPSPPSEDPLDEVTKRWVMSVGKEQDFFYPDFCEDEGYQDIQSSSGTDKRNREASEETWNHIENHIRDSDTWWRNEKPTVLPNVRRTESVKNASLDRKPSFLQNLRQSFSKKPPHPKSPDNLEQSFRAQKHPEGFCYIPPPNSNADKSNPFNVKLKHVPRPSIPNEETEKNNTETSGNSGGEANPYLISPLSGLDPDYVPRNHYKFPITPPISPPSDDESKSNYGNLEPPPLPPPDTPQTPSDLGFKLQMSLEEAIRTRRPLKPINRPPIDTTC